MNAPEPIPFNAEGPQPLMREIPAGTPYPVEALGPLKSVVEAVQDISQAPVAIAAQSALAVASLAVQGFANVETLGGDAPLSLFCLTIAESGERKSTCDRLLIEGLREFERSRESDYKKAFEQWEVDHKVFTEKRKRLTTDAAGGNASKANIAHNDLKSLGSEPSKPLLANVTAGEPTFEGLLKLYRIGRPSLGLFSDEAGGFVGGHAMNSDNKLKTMAGLSNLWNGQPVDRTRAGDDVATYRGRRLAAHLMAQPIVARPFLADPEASGQGFLARFLITEPSSHIGMRLKRDFDPLSRVAIDGFARQLRNILDKPLPTTDDPQELNPVRLPLDHGARDYLWMFYEYVEKAQVAGGEYEQVRAYASKAAEQAARIAGVLTLWGNLNATSVTVDLMKYGVSLAQYYLEEAKRLAEAGAISAEVDRAETLRKWLIEKWDKPEILTRNIVIYGPNKLRESAVAKSAIDILEKHGWLVRLPAGTVIDGAARKEAYRIVRPSHAV